LISSFARGVDWSAAEETRAKLSTKAATQMARAIGCNGAPVRATLCHPLGFTIKAKKLAAETTEGAETCADFKNVSALLAISVANLFFGKQQQR